MVGITEKLISLLPDSKGSSYLVVHKIIKSKFLKVHESLGIGYSTAYSSFRSYITPFVSDSHLYGTHSTQ